MMQVRCCLKNFAGSHAALRLHRGFLALLAVPMACIPANSAEGLTWPAMCSSVPAALTRVPPLRVVPLPDVQSAHCCKQ